MKLNVPWFVVGDFNTVLSSSEKKEAGFQDNYIWRILKIVY